MTFNIVTLCSPPEPNSITIITSYLYSTNYVKKLTLFIKLQLHNIRRGLSHSNRYYVSMKYGCTVSEICKPIDILHSPHTHPRSAVKIMEKH